jgi:hypothetical protein
MQNVTPFHDATTTELDAALSHYGIDEDTWRHMAQQALITASKEGLTLKLPLEFRGGCIH